MICIRAFPTRSEILAVLATAGLAREWDGELQPDTTCADVFEVWDRKQVDDEWVDDTSKPSKWVANLELDACPEPLEPYQDFPVNPRRVFAGDVK